MARFASISLLIMSNYPTIVTFLALDFFTWSGIEWTIGNPQKSDFFLDCVYTDMERHPYFPVLSPRSSEISIIRWRALFTSIPSFLNLCKSQEFFKASFFIFSAVFPVCILCVCIQNYVALLLFLPCCKKKQKFHYFFCGTERNC